MGAKFILTQNEEGTFAFSFQMLDGRVILSGQGCADKETAINRINAVRHLVSREQNFEVVTAEDGQAHLVLRNRHKEVIGQSEVYPDAESLPWVIALARGNVRGAQVEDLTGE